MLALSCFAVGGCAEVDGAADALAAAEPYVDRFDRFDAWARRTVAADPAIRGAAFLEETLFAPLFLERDIAGAWVIRRRIEHGAWSLRAGAPPDEDAGWVQVRHPRHGELGVLVAPLASPGAPAQRCVFLSRRGPGAASSRIDVIVAFAIEAPGAS